VGVGDDYPRWAGGNNDVRAALPFLALPAPQDDDAPSVGQSTIVDKLTSRILRDDEQAADVKGPRAALPVAAHRPNWADLTIER